jgi:hypothetical protein
VDEHGFADRTQRPVIPSPIGYPHSKEAFHRRNYSGGATGGRELDRA